MTPERETIIKLSELSRLRLIEDKARELAQRTLSFEQVCYTNNFPMPKPLGNLARELLDGGDNAK